MKSLIRILLASAALLSAHSAQSSLCENLISTRDWKMSANGFRLDIRINQAWNENGTVKFYGHLLDHYRGGLRDELRSGTCYGDYVVFDRLWLHSDGSQGWQRYSGYIYYRGATLTMDGNFNHAGNSNYTWNAYPGRW